MMPRPWWGGGERRRGSAHAVARDLDLHDLNYLASKRHVQRGAHDGVSRLPAIVRSSALFVGRWARSIVAPGATMRHGALRGRVLMGIASRNQRRVADALLASEVSGVAPISTVSLVTKGIGSKPRLPLAAAYWDALRCGPSTISKARADDGAYRGAWIEHGAEYALTPGLYVLARRWLAGTKPAVVMVSNDHVMRTRVFLLAARDEGIPTAYVQHASVTDKFPPLSIDVAFLDGRDALEKYLGAGPTRAHVFLTGSPLHDALVAGRDERAPSASVGICLNLLDDPTRVRALVEALRTRGCREIEIRAHPRDDRPWRSWLPSTMVESVRSAREEHIERFFGRVGAVFAGDSNVHLEATLYGRASVYVRPLGAGSDAYGFARAGLVHDIHDLAELPEPLETLFDAALPEAPLRRFDATVGTRWSGQSSRLIREVLTAIVQRSKTPPTTFEHSVALGDARVYALRSEDLEGLVAPGLARPRTSGVMA